MPDEPSVTRVHTAGVQDGWHRVEEGRAGAAWGAAQAVDLVPLVRSRFFSACMCACGGEEGGRWNELKGGRSLPAPTPTCSREMERSYGRCPSTTPARDAAGAFAAPLHGRQDPLARHDRTRRMVAYASWNFASSLLRSSVLILRLPSVARTRHPGATPLQSALDFGGCSLAAPRSGEWGGTRVGCLVTRPQAAKPGRRGPGAGVSLAGRSISRH